MAAAMDRAIDQFLNGPSSSDEAQLQLWPEEAVHLLLFTCSKDPSVRIRRAAMSLLTSVVSKQQSAQEEAIVRALVLKCRDKDAKVQSQAYEMLVQLPIETLTAYLQIDDWRAVLDTALLNMQAAVSDSLADEDHQRDSAVHALGIQLLQKYLDTNKVLQALCSDAASADEEGVDAKAVLQAVCHASQYLQALQLPWHSSVVHHAYSSALAACHQHH